MRPPRSYVLLCRYYAVVSLCMLCTLCIRQKRFYVVLCILMHQKLGKEPPQFRKKMTLIPCNEQGVQAYMPVRRMQVYPKTGLLKPEYCRPSKVIVFDGEITSIMVCLQPLTQNKKLIITFNTWFFLLLQYIPQNVRSSSES